MLNGGEFLCDDAGVGHCHAYAHGFHVGDALANGFVADTGVIYHKLEAVVHQATLHIEEELAFWQIGIEREQKHAQFLPVFLGNTGTKVHVKHQAAGFVQFGEHEGAGHTRRVNGKIGKPDFFAAGAHCYPLIILTSRDEMLAHLGQ